MKSLFNNLKSRLINFSNTKFGLVTLFVSMFFLFFVVRDLFFYIILLIFKLEL